MNGDAGATRESTGFPTCCFLVSFFNTTVLEPKSQDPSIKPGLFEDVARPGEWTQLSERCPFAQDLRGLPRTRFARASTAVGVFPGPPPPTVKWVNTGKVPGNPVGVPKS